MTTNRQPPSETFSDILVPQASTELVKTVELLARSLTAVYVTEAPSQVVATIERLATGSPATTQSRLSIVRQMGVGPWLPRRIRPVFAVLLVMLLAAATYAGVPIAQRAFYVDAGTRQILNQDLGTRLDLSQTEAGYTVTVTRAYADANRVVVGYTVQGPNNQPLADLDRLSYLQSTLTDASGKALDPLGGGAVAQGGSVLDNFDASSIQGRPNHLSLQLSIPLLHALAEDGQPVPANSESFTFRFTVPFLPGRIAAPNETVTAGGQSVTLERVVVSPSETRLYLRGLGGTGILPQLVVAGWDSQKVSPVGWAAGQAIGVSGGVWEANDGLIVCDFPSPLMDKQGEWSLLLKAGPPTADGRQVRGGPWVFHFTVPAMNP